MAADTEKARQRLLALAARRSLTEEERREKSERICRRLLALPQIRQARVILSYTAVDGEADLGRLHESLLAAGKTLAFPVCGEKGQMDAYVPLGRMRSGCFGIPEPDPAVSRALAPEEIDLILVPVVAFDGACRRLGHGGGYYDRFLARRLDTLRVAAAFEIQRLDRVVTETHDRLMDWVITEEAVYQK